MKMIITIGGPIGSGTTTVAAAAAEHLGLKHIYAGNIFRQMASERGMTLGEFSKFAEGNDEVDKEIDRRQKEMAAKGNCIVEGRLSAHLMQADLKVWFTAPLNIRVERVVGREGKDIEVAKQETEAREASEKKRYKAIYGIDIDDLSPYDVVINTEHWNAEGIIAILEMMIRSMGS